MENLMHHNQPEHASAPQQRRFEHNLPRANEACRMYRRPAIELFG
jgi:hypothetical protein